MTRTSDVVALTLPDSLPCERVVCFEQSVIVASHVKLEGKTLTFMVGPTWFNSPIVERHVTIVPLRARLKEGYKVAGYIEAFDKRWKVMVEVSPQ